MSPSVNFRHCTRNIVILRKKAQPQQKEKPRAQAKKKQSKSQPKSEPKTKKLDPNKFSFVDNLRNTGAMFTIKTISHPTSDIKHPSLLLESLSGKRYIFGSVPEGTQRCLVEHKHRVSKLSSVFLTGEISWDSIGGLPGLILTVSDQGKKDLNIAHSNPLLNYIISTWRYFVFRFGMSLSPLILNPQQPFKDELLTVAPYTLLPQASTPQDLNQLSEETDLKLQTIVKNMFPLATSSKNTQHDEPMNLNKDQGYINVKLPEISQVKVSTCYSIKFNSIRGRFDVAKAMELGVPKGPLFGKLTNGVEVQLDSGAVIKPEQVLSETRAFEKVLVIDIPSSQYLKAAYDTKWVEQDEKVALVYHFLGKDVNIDDKYESFINSFGEGVQHILSHPKYCPNSITFKRFSTTILNLKSISKDQYNLPYTNLHTAVLPDSITSSTQAHLALLGQSVVVECSVPAVRNKVTVNNKEAQDLLDNNSWDKLYDEQIKNNTSYTKKEILSDASVSKSQPDPARPIKDQVEVITLGTGSALPSMHRNVLSNLVRIPFKNEATNAYEYKSIFLDAGEGSLGTLKRTVGDDEQTLQKYFNELQTIYLSHLHADHHLGIVSLLKEWFKHNQHQDGKYLYLVLPWQYNHFINEWVRLEDFNEQILARIRYLSCEQLLAGRPRDEVEQMTIDEFNAKTADKDKFEFIEFSRDFNKINVFYEDNKIKRFSTCRAIHCNWAYSCSITYQLDEQNEFKVSFSGDTRPNLYKFSNGIGKHSDLLIHEATLENELIEDAKIKRHCTINEAIEVANAMETKKLILTHFSQRYPKVPNLESNDKINSPCCFAFDSMIVDYGGIDEQAKVLHKMSQIFSMEEQAAKKDELE